MTGDHFSCAVGQETEGPPMANQMVVAGALYAWDVPWAMAI